MSQHSQTDGISNVGVDTVAKVLVVDDEKSIRHTLAAFLQNSGHTPFLAVNAAEAEARFAKVAIDVAVIDIMLGDDNGLKVARRLGECQPNTQIIFMTGHPELESAREAVRLHVFDYMTKPTGKSEIIEVVNRAFAEKQRRDEYDRLQAETRDDHQRLEELVEKRTDALRQSETRFRLMFEGHDSVMLLIEPESGAIVDANKAAAQFYGYSHDQLCSMPIDDINCLSPAEVAAERLRASREDQNHFIFQHKLCNGQIRTVEVHSTPMKIQDGQVLFSIIHDITERKQAEEENKKNRSMLQKAEEISNQGAWEWDILNDQWILTENWLRIHGCSVSGISRNELMVLAHPDDASRVERLFQDALAGKAEYRIEHRIIRQNDKEVRVVRVLGEVVRDDTGLPVKMWGVAQDITELKLAEEKRTESEQRFRSTIEDLQLGIVINAPDSSIVLSNPAACRILGLSAEQISGKTVTDPLWHFVRVDGSDLPSEELPVARAISTGKTISNQIVGIMKPDHTEPTWVNANAVPVFSKDNQLLRVIGNFMDISERKRAEEAARGSEENLRLIIDTSPIGICMVDPLGNFVMTNLAYEQMLGYSKEELRGLSFYDVTHPEDRPENKERFQSMFSLTSTGFFMEKQYVCKDGATIDVAVNAIGVMDAAGHARFGTAFVSDISARKESEKVLHESEETNRATFEQAAIGIAHVGLDGKWLCVNDKLCAIVGYTRDELIKLTFQDITHPEDLDKDLANVKQMLEGDSNSYSMEKRYIRKDRSEVWINLTVSLVKTEAGAPLHFISIVENISARKLAEEEIKRQRDLFGLVINSVPSRIFWKDLDSVYLGCNTHFAKDSGMKHPEDVIGKDDHDMVWGKDADHYRADDNLVISTGKSRLDYEEEFLDVEGKKVWWLTQKMPLRNREGEIVGIIATSENVTEKKSAEEELNTYRKHLEELVEKRTAEITKLNAEQQTIFDSVRALIWFKDTENRFLRVNQAAAESVGLTVAEIEGKTAEELFSEEAEWFYADDLEVIKSGQSKLGIVESLQTAAGDTNWYITDKIPHCDAAGNIAGVIVFCMDITDQKVAEEEASRRTADLQKTVKAMAGREVRMAELKKEMARLRRQFEKTGIKPVETEDGT